MPDHWRHRALCRGFDTDVFFPPPGFNVERARAQDFCVTCPVQLWCLECALADREHYGIWGGTNERNRRHIRVARKRMKAA